MASRRDYYFRQLVSEAELDAGFAGLEDADRQSIIDVGNVGIVSGLTVTQEGSPSLFVQVAAGVAYDQAGERMNVPTLQNLTCALDENGLTTAVTTPGNSKSLAIFLEFDRALTDPRIDGNGDTVYFVRAESFKLNVVQSAEAVSPTLVPLRSDQILLADVTHAYGATTIVTGNIDTSRRQDVLRTSGSPFAIIAGNAAGGVDATLSALNAYVAEVAATTSSNDGAKHVGAQTSGGLSSGTVRSQLDALDTAKVAKAGDTMTGNLVLSSTFEVNYSAPRSRVVQIPLAAFHPCQTSAGVGEWYLDGSTTPPQWTSRVAQGRLVCPIQSYLVDGCTITQIRFLLHPSSAQATSGNRMSCTVTREHPDFVTPAAPAQDTLTAGSATDNASNALQVVTLTPTTLTVDKTTRAFFLKVVSNVDASGSLFHSCELTTTSPGPRG
jgi:hypothetical protein